MREWKSRENTTRRSAQRSVLACVPIAKSPAETLSRWSSKDLASTLLLPSSCLLIGSFAHEKHLSTLLSTILSTIFTSLVDNKSGRDLQLPAELRPKRKRMPGPSVDYLFLALTIGRLERHQSSAQSFYLLASSSVLITSSAGEQAKDMTFSGVVNAASISSRARYRPCGGRKHPARRLFCDLSRSPDCRR